METVYDNGIKYEIWVALWQKLFSQNPKLAFQNMVYIGYCGRFIDAVTIYKYRNKDLLKTSKRKVFNCFVIGHH
jgi:endo-alpha-1,4-polygalactosaminidase (GH114 family)